MYHEAYRKQHLSDLPLATEHNWEHCGNRHTPKPKAGDGGRHKVAQNGDH